ncbi:hypothetical protein BKA69DRAFT_1049676 [Paraphysoderma sedebokerense]|nr:hypothetical protein BKA69DRAFT_1049676 [Paraphysoderma sedebokerense]
MSVEIRSLGSFNFSHYPPEVDSVLPVTASTSGPIDFTIFGQNFWTCLGMTFPPCNQPIGIPNITVTVGDKNCSDIRYSSVSLSHQSTLTCTVSDGLAGVDLDVVVNFFGQNSSISSTAKFSSYPPSIGSTSRVRILLFPDNTFADDLSIEGQSFGPPSTAAHIIFTAINGLNYTACSSPVLLNHTLATCNLSHNLPSPAIYNVSILVSGQYSNADKQIKYGNYPPNANSAEVSMDEDTMYQVVLSGSDPDGDPIEVLLTELPENGKLFQFDISKRNALGFEADLGGLTLGRVMDNAGRMIYIPNPDFNGRDSFSYIVADRALYGVMTNSTPAIYSMIVKSVPDAPIVSTVRIQVQEDSNEIINIAVTDIDTPLADISIVIDSLPGDGRIEYMLDSLNSVNVTAVPSTTPPGYHSFKYIPNLNYFGIDQFTYYATDGLTNSTTATAVITVQSMNDKPIALSDFVITNEDQGCIIRLQVEDVDQPATVKQRVKILSWDDTLGNLHQVDANGLKYGASIGPNTEVLDMLNRIWFEPKPNESGLVNLTFSATDAQNAMSNPATIMIQITSINDAPFTSECNKDIILAGKSNVSFSLTASNYDNDDVLTFQLTSIPKKGRLTHLGSELFLYDTIRKATFGNSDVSIALQFEGLNMGGGNPFDNFTYVVSDKAGARTDQCIVHLKIRCPPPLVNNVFAKKGDICELCPKGAICSQDGSSPIFADRGYWLHPNDNMTLLTCMPESACVGQQEQICADGYEGIRCGTCKKKYYRRNLECIPCTQDQAIFIGVVVTALVLGLMGLYVMINFSSQASR